MLKINTENTTPSESESESSDVVGRFRAGYQDSEGMHSLPAFRVTTGDAKLMDELVKLFGLNKDFGPDAGPQEWDATGEDFLEAYTAAAQVNIVLEGASAYRSSLVRRTADGDFMYSTDGEIITAVGEDYEDEFEVGNPDPQAGQDINTRKAKAKKGLGSKPDIRVRFRIADHEDFGVFEYRTGGWSLVDNSPEGKLQRLGEGHIKAVLKLSEVKTKRWTYTKPELLVRGLVDGPQKPAVEADDEDESPIK
jgi:hypothetical protein